MKVKKQEKNTQLSVNLLERAVEDHTSAWALITQKEDLEEAAASRAQLSPALIILAIW